MSTDVHQPAIPGGRIDAGGRVSGSQARRDVIDPAAGREARTAGARFDGRDRQRERFGGLNWGAASFGWLVAIGIAAILTAILSAAGAAIGLTSISSAEAQKHAATIGIGGGIALLIVLLAAYYAGGYCRPPRAATRTRGLSPSRLSPSTRIVRRHCLAAGVPERLAHPHAFRAYWASRCLGADIPVHGVSARLGHVDPRTTARYAAPRPERVDDVADVLDLRHQGLPAGGWGGVKACRVAVAAAGIPNTVIDYVMICHIYECC